MNVLQLSLDSNLLNEATALSDEARRRQLKYAEELRRRAPGSRLFIVVRSASGEGRAPRAAVLAVGTAPRALRGEGLEIHPAPASALGFIAEACRYGRTLSRQHDLDLVTSQTPFVDGLAGWLLRSCCGKKWLVQLHTSRLDNPYWLAESRANHVRSWLGRLVLRRADAVRVVSQSAAGWLQHTLGVPQDRVFVVPVGTELVAEPVPLPEAETSRGDLLFVGRLTREKGVSSLLRALPHIQDTPHTARSVLPSRSTSFAPGRSPGQRPGVVARRVAPPLPLGEAQGKDQGSSLATNGDERRQAAAVGLAEDGVPTLVIVGDGPERSRLEKLAAALGLQGRVRFAGMVPHEQLASFYSRAAVVVVPSLHESYGRVIVEAMAFGRAVVATDTDGAKDLIEDGQTGFIVPIRDAEALADKISYVLSNPQVARRVGEAARRFVTRTQEPRALCRAQVDMWLTVAGRRGAVAEVVGG